ncbi:MAG: hypothetical protein N3E47_00790 [Candidatus Bathyarchaeota archaeon]|nr:hypothetical protein [Candidatus Bathyarchaeota archaeon]
MDEHLIGDGIFMIKEENNRIIITLCAWTRRKEREMIRLLNSRRNTEIHVHNKGYIYEEIRGEEIEISPFAEL